MFVFFGKEGVGGGDPPVDAQFGIVPGDGAFVGGTIEVVALVLEDDFFGEDAEAMGKTPRDEHHPVVLPCQLFRMPFPVGGRPFAKVHGNVQHGAAHHADELRLGVLPFLEMEPADHSVAGLALVVLDEPDRSHQLMELPFVEHLKEIAPCVPEHFRLDDDEPFDTCLDNRHSRSMHFFRESYQCGTSMPKVSLTLVLSRTEK